MGPFRGNLTLLITYPYSMSPVVLRKELWNETEETSLLVLLHFQLIT